MSKKTKKTKNKEDDEMWDKKEKEVEKKKRDVELKEDEDQELTSTGFEFRFSNEKEFMKKEKEIQRKEIEREKLMMLIRQQEEEQMEQEMKRQHEPSDADLAEQLDRKEREKKSKERKEKLKVERREAQRMADSIEEARRAQEMVVNKAVEVGEKERRQRQSHDGIRIVIGLLIFILIAAYLQYRGEVNQRLEFFRIKDSEDLYDILGADSGLSDTELKQRYKNLALKYHPDKNSECKDCKERFAKVLKAWQILGNPEKRKIYDQTSGLTTKIKSKSITLTPQNFYEEVEDSNDLWIIQVYDSTSTYCHHYSQFWQQITSIYSGFVKFGRIDMWSQDDMKSFIPYSFTIFPSIYSIRNDKGGDLYGLETQNPINSLRKFIEKELAKQYTESRISFESLTKELGTLTKPLVLMGSHPTYQLKSILSKYEVFISSYILESSNLLRLESSEVRIYSSSDNFDKYTLKSPDNYLQFSQTLPKYFVQQMTVCQMTKYCSDIPCLLLLGANITRPKSLYPQIRVSDPTLDSAIADVKNKTGMNENFEAAIYQNGNIELGYMDDVGLMNIDEGEIIELQCIPRARIPYMALTKIAALLFGLIFFKNRKVQIAFGLMIGYMVYSLF